MQVKKINWELNTIPYLRKDLETRTHKAKNRMGTKKSLETIVINTEKKGQRKSKESRDGFEGQKINKHQLI